MLSQRPHNVIQALADQDDLPILDHPLAQLRQSFRPELALQDVFKVLLPEQIQAVAAHAAQERMQDSCGQYPMACIERWPKQGLQEKTPSACPALREGVGIPGEISNWTHRRQMRQTAFYAPEDGPLSLIVIAV